jgi:deazaflavin-dependent oxidoreductase (nitroreductase family)
MSVDSQATKPRQTGGVGQTLQRLFMKGHVSFYRLTGGKVGGGKSFLILTTIGRKSGVERNTPLFFFTDADHFIIIASNGGAPKHPTWWLNLQSNPQAKVQIGPRVIPVTARQADAEESKHLWSIIAEKYKNFVGYQKRTSREIPIVILTPEV